MPDGSGPPFRADHVGSLVRPPELLDARAKHAAGELDDTELRGIEDEAIADVVRKQRDVGQRTATDGIGEVTDENIVVHFRNADGTIAMEGNALTRDQQIAELELIVQTAEEVWG